MLRSEEGNEESSSDERFNTLDIRYPICYRIVPNRDNEQLCECNLPIKRHEQETRQLKFEKSGIEKKWDRKTNVILVRDGAHGRLVNGALYARIDLKTDLNIVQDLLMRVWKFPTPKLIMSIIGGSKHFTLTDRLETNFINGIISIAIRSDIWTITNGYNNGLVQLIGQAIHKTKLRKPKRRMPTLAICKWGSVKNAQKLIDLKKKGTKQITKTTNFSQTSDNDDDEDTETPIRKKDQHDLDMNHSHYLMLDDARYRYIDTGEFRTRLCSQMIKLGQKEDFYTPAVTMVVDGGDATISNIYYDLKSNIPIVIIEGSGGVADFFSRWLLCTKDLDKDVKRRDIIYAIDDIRLRDRVTKVSEQQFSIKSGGISEFRVNLHEVHIDLDSKTLPDLFKKWETQLPQELEKLIYHDEDSNTTQPLVSNEKIGIACQQMMFCLQPSIRSNITVFNLNSENDLSETVFRRISETYERFVGKKRPKYYGEGNHVQLDSKKKERIVERTPLLELAMDWDCIQVAKEFVFQNSLENISDVETAFKDALKKNLHTFVYEFIKLGVRPGEIFFPGNTFINGPTRYQEFINDLYSNTIIKQDTTHLKSIIDEDSAFIEKKISVAGDLNVILRTLIGDYMCKLYYDTLKEEYNDRIKSGLTITLLQRDPQESKDYENMRPLSLEEKREMARDYIMRDLFLWAVLMNYTDMAKVLLAHMKYRICPALIATKIFKQYHHKATYGDLKKGYMESATYFEQYAINCLDKCDDYDVNKACEIVLQRNELYGYVTCLQVAADAEDKLFLATPCCVQAMNNVWYDKLYPDQSGKRDIMKLILGFVSLGFAAPPLVEYRQVQQVEIGVSLKPTLRPNGINYADPYPLEHPRYSKSQLEINRYIHRLFNFHRSLLMKFCYRLITYLFFLLLFSYVLLFNFDPPTDQHPSIHWTEILTIILVSCMLIAEIHYFLTQDSLTFFGKIDHYFRDIFKLLSLIAFILFYIGLIVRFTHATSEEDFTAARIIMAIDIELWWLRLLSFIIVIPFLGPHLVAIGEMLKDLLFFMCIIAIVMVGYGVASRSMVYYPTVNNFTTDTGGFINTSFDGRLVFRQILYPVYYLMYGQVDTELGNLDTNPNAGWSITTHVLLAIHMLFVNILLINLLIAMFSKRFDQVYKDTQTIWHSQQYLFTREYYTRAPLFPPISLIYDLYHLCRMFLFFVRQKLFKESADRDIRVFKMIPMNITRIKDWYKFEAALTYEYAHGEVKASQNPSQKSSNRQDSQNAENKKDMINNQEDSNEVVDNLKQVREDVARLNASIEEMKGDVNRSCPRLVPPSPTL